MLGRAVYASNGHSDQAMMLRLRFHLRFLSYLVLLIFTWICG